MLAVQKHSQKHDMRYQLHEMHKKSTNKYLLVILKS